MHFLGQRRSSGNAHLLTNNMKQVLRDYVVALVESAVTYWEKWVHDFLHVISVH